VKIQGAVEPKVGWKVVHPSAVSTPSNFQISNCVFYVGVK
jgi:hypothetical protein